MKKKINYLPMESYFEENNSSNLLKNKFDSNNLLKVKILKPKENLITEIPINLKNNNYQLNDTNYKLFSKIENDTTKITNDSFSTIANNITNCKNIKYHPRPAVLPDDFKKIVEPINTEIINSKITYCIKKNDIIFPEIEYHENPEEEYYEDIFKELLIEEENNMSFKKCIYLNYHLDLDKNKRAFLISFMYEIAKMYGFKRKTVYMSVQTFDRFLCKEKVDKEYFQLLCIAVVMISAKFNEIYYPNYSAILSVFGKENNYTVKQACTMELLILRTLDYNLFPITPSYFFEIICKIINLSTTEYYLGSLMIELTQFDFSLYSYKNSLIVQSILCKIITITEKPNCDPLKLLKNLFPEESFEINNEKFKEIQNCSNVIESLLQNLNAEFFKDIYEYYRRPEILGNSINYFLRNNLNFNGYS